MAKTCIHDSRSVCATSADGCTRRSFLDQCDMYEYNCDYNTQFAETECLEVKNQIPLNGEVNDSDSIDKIELLSDPEEKLKLDLKITTSKHGDNVLTLFGQHCGRPSTWATTRKGETRDFFRILKD
ncbi:unnamed protein product [Leptosia nina]|uniref:Uncharacterized protein n=1 Tax=Leptosia nina TaxID=320188 RepID=A0AAV1J9U7_9NEOP